LQYHKYCSCRIALHFSVLFSTFWQLVMGTVEDLHNLYPNVVPCNLNSEIKGTSINQVHFPRT
jgi:hypothetical protein